MLGSACAYGRRPAISRYGDAGRQYRVVATRRSPAGHLHLAFMASYHSIRQQVNFELAASHPCRRHAGASPAGPPAHSAESAPAVGVRSSLQFVHPRHWPALSFDTVSTRVVYIYDGANAQRRCASLARFRIQRHHPVGITSARAVRPCRVCAHSIRIYPNTRKANKDKYRLRGHMGMSTVV